MNSKKITGTLLLVAGIILVILFAIADLIGIGRYPGFGPIQIAGVIIGAVITISGLIVLRKKKTT